MLLAGFIPFLSTDAGKTFQNLAPLLPGFYTNYTALYGGNSGGFGVRSIFRSPVDHNSVRISWIAFLMTSVFI